MQTEVPRTLADFPVKNRFNFRRARRKELKKYWYEHRMFKSPENSVNLHLFSEGCPEVGRMLALRDWLRTNEADRDLYAECKRALAQQEWKYTQN